VYGVAVVSTCRGVGVVCLTVGRLRVCSSRTASFDILLVVIIIIVVVMVTSRRLLLLLLTCVGGAYQQFGLVISAQDSAFCSDAIIATR